MKKKEKKIKNKIKIIIDTYELFYFRWGNRPIDIAQTCGHEKIVNYLNQCAQKTAEEENNIKENNNIEVKVPENCPPDQPPLP